MKTVLNHECSSVPTSMFDNEGKMKIVTMKSKLKTKVQVTVPQRLVNTAEVEIVDGCVIPWLNQGTEEDFVNGFTRNVMKRTVSQDTRQTIASHLNITMRVEAVSKHLVMVLHALRLECKMSVELTASSHRSCFLSLSRKSRDEAAL